MIEMEKKSVQSKQGTCVYYMKKNENENAKCIFFLHGLTANHALFEKQYPYFAKKYTIMAWDAPGHGASRPYTDIAYQNGAEVLKAILDQEGIKKVIMAGQSMGGYHIQTFMKKYAAMVEAFIGIDTCPFGKQYYTKSDYFWLKQIGWMSMLYPEHFLKKNLAKICGVTSYGRQNMLDCVSIYSKKELCSLIGRGYAGFCEANEDITISCKTLILLGDHDHIGKLRQYNKMWQKNADFTFVPIANASHNSNADNPDAVNQAIDEFLQTI